MNLAEKAIALDREGYHFAPFDPGPYFRAVTDDSVTFEEFVKDPAVRTSMYGHVYTEKELRSLWNVVLFQREALLNAVERFGGRVE